MKWNVYKHFTENLLDLKILLHCSKILQYFAKKAIFIKIKFIHKSWRVLDLFSLESDDLYIMLL